MKELTNEQFDLIRNMIRYSFAGPMVGKNAGEFLSYEEIHGAEQEAYGPKVVYDEVIELMR